MRRGNGSVFALKGPILSALRHACGGSAQVLQIRRSGGQPGAGGDELVELVRKGYHRVLKLAGGEGIQSVHLAEALHIVPVFFGSTGQG